MSKKLPENLIEQACKNRLIPIIGAGVSRALKNKNQDVILPEWAGFIRASCNELKKERKTKHRKIVKALIKLNQLQEAAEYAKKGLTTNLWLEFLKEQFDLPFINIDESSTALLQNICQLSSKIITLNYDLSLEKLSKQKIAPQEIDNSNTIQLNKFSKNEGEKTLIWHLHGHIEAPEHIIATTTDYDDLYNNQSNKYKAAVKVLEQLVATHTLLFIGCSLNDIELLDVLQEQNNLFNGSTGPHYALLRKKEAAPVQERLSAQNKEIEIVEFKDFGEPLVELIELLAKERKERNTVLDEYDELKQKGIIGKIGILDERLATYGEIDQLYYTNPHKNHYQLLQEIKKSVSYESSPLNIVYLEQFSTNGDFLVIGYDDSLEKTKIEKPINTKSIQEFLATVYVDKTFTIQDITPTGQPLSRYLAFSIEHGSSNDANSISHPDSVNHALCQKIASLLCDLAIKNHFPNTVLTSFTATNCLLEQTQNKGNSTNNIHTIAIRIKPKDLNELPFHQEIFETLVTSIYLLHINSLSLQNIAENFISYHDNTFIFWRTSSNDTSIKNLTKRLLTQIKKQLKTKVQTYDIGLLISNAKVSECSKTQKWSQKLHHHFLKNMSSLDLTKELPKQFEIKRIVNEKN